MANLKHQPDLIRISTAAKNLMSRRQSITGAAKLVAGLGIGAQVMLGGKQARRLRPQRVVGLDLQPRPQVALRPHPVPRSHLRDHRPVEKGWG
jgi:hypothetical protein